jgi:MarR family transcriptional regulator, organic hydroperoxide resistance regulator
VAAYEHLLLENQLCFALYAATNAVTRAYRAPLGKLGLTYPQYLAMVVLWERGSDTVKGLADALQLDSSTLTPLLKRLEAAGWLSRKRDRVDERIVRIELTPAGKALRRPVAAIQTGVACRTRLPGAEFVALRAQLHALAETLAGAEVPQAV